MKETVSRLKRDLQYYNIYADLDNPARFIYGSIVASDEGMVAVKMVSPEGLYDGVIVMPIDKIIRIDTSLPYKKRMEILMRKQSFAEKEIHIDDEDVLVSALRCAMEAKTPVSIELVDSGNDNVTGYVTGISDVICEIDCFDFYGEHEGKSYMRLDDITQLCFESSDEQVLKMLSEQ